uniref:Uncharacterized protein n=1 Tax=Arundo donax TaxID=35708 RepID=A0A0A9C452_ARUDO
MPVLKCVPISVFPRSADCKAVAGFSFKKINFLKRFSKFTLFSRVNVF